MMRPSRVSLLIVLLIMMLMLAACGSSSATTQPPAGSSTSSAKATACNGLSTINQALTSLSGTQVNTTVGDVQAAQQKVTNAVNTIAKIPAASGPLLDQIKAANDQLTAKLAGYPPNTPIGQTSVKVQDVKTTAASAQSKTTAIASRLKCPS